MNSNARNTAIYRQRTEGGAKFAAIAKRYGISTDRARQVFLAEQNKRRLDWLHVGSSLAWAEAHALRDVFFNRYYPPSPYDPCTPHDPTSL